MSGVLRRPPQLWEQRLQRLIPSIGLQGAADSVIVNDPAPGPGGPGEEPADPPVLDEDPSTPRAPSSPLVSSGIGGIIVFWSGTDNGNRAYPPGVYAEVHVSTASGFTPSSSTFRGRIDGAGRLDVTGLTSGTTYYVRLVVVLLDGTKLDPTTQVSAVAGFVLSSNIGTGEIGVGLINFDATSIGGIQQFVGTATPAVTGSGTAQRPVDGSTWINTGNGSYYTLSGGSWVQRQWGGTAIAAGAITALQIATGAITAESAIIGSAAIGSAQIQDASITSAKIVSLDASKITAGTMSGDRIQGGTITGSAIASSGSGSRIVLRDVVDGVDNLTFFNSSSERVGRMRPLSDGLTVSGTAFKVDAPAYFDGSLFSQNVYDNPQTGNDEVAINTAYRMRRLSSSQAIKYDIATVTAELSTAVDAERQTDVVTVTPSDLLNVAVVEFSAIDDGEPSDRRLLGFIAEDMAEKFPIGVTRKADGSPSGIQTQGVLAALLAVVQGQQDQLDTLTARIEALEG